VVVARIFISYATPDRVIADEVSGWLRAAGHDPFLAHDLRDGISAGEDWEQRLYRELREVDAVIGVVTSSLRAAVLPLLDGDPAWLTVSTVVPGSDPLPEPARALVMMANPVQLGWSASDVRDRLDAGTDGLRRVADDLLAADTGTHQRRLLIPIDQAEELFTRTAPDARERFVQLLREAVTGPVRASGLRPALREQEDRS
jgi:conflict system STAND superfamily ATPase/TIR domain-containing protein